MPCGATHVLPPPPKSCACCPGANVCPPPLRCTLLAHTAGTPSLDTRVGECVTSGGLQIGQTVAAVATLRAGPAAAVPTCRENAVTSTAHTTLTKVRSPCLRARAWCACFALLWGWRGRSGRDLASLDYNRASGGVSREVGGSRARCSPRGHAPHHLLLRGAPRSSLWAWPARSRPVG